VSLKPNIKALGLALIAVFAFGAMVASAAQAAEDAPHFTVQGASPTATTFGERTFAGSNEGPVTTNNESRKLKLESPNNGDCTVHGFIVSSAPEQPSTFKEVTFTCTNVKVFINGIDRTALCPAHSPGAANGTIKTTDLDGRLVWTASSGDEQVGWTFTPEAGAGQALEHIEITGATCPLATGATPLKVLGNMIATNDSPTTEDATTQKIVFPATPDTHYWTNQTPTRTEDIDSGLTLGGTAAAFAGTFAIHLSTDELWGVEPG
jgi:hypothetical protein